MCYTERDNDRRVGKGGALMKITWIGHACFKLEHEGSSVVIDPYSDGSVPGLLPVKETADMVLCSHGHGDHNAAGNVQITGKAADMIKVTAIDSFHDDKEGSLRGKNKIFVLEWGGYKIVHFGDIGCQLTGEQAEQVSGADLAMIPVGGYYTVDAAEAAQILKEVSPKLVIPMHFSGDSYGYDEISTVDPFAALKAEAVRSSGSEILLEEWLPGREGSTVILTPKNLA